MRYAQNGVSNLVIIWDELLNVLELCRKFEVGCFLN